MVALFATINPLNHMDETSQQTNQPLDPARGKPLGSPSTNSAGSQQAGSGQAQGKPKMKFNFGAWWNKSTGQPLRTRDKVVLIVFGLVFLFVFYITLDANKYPALVRVVEGEGKVGVNPTDLALDFGDLARGTSAVRRVDIQNGTFMPMYVLVWKVGSISSLIEVDKASFRLGPNSGTKIEFLSYMPASAEVERIYKGRVFIFKIPTFGL